MISNKKYFRVMLGSGSRFAKQCYNEGFIGTDFSVKQDLSSDLSVSWRVFNTKYAPIYLAGHPGKTRVAAGLACGALWTVSKGIREGDIVLCPTGEGTFYVGEVTGKYQYLPGQVLFHRRPVNWNRGIIEKSSMTEALSNSASGPGTVREISHHATELEKLISGGNPQIIVATDLTIEDPTVFALEKHLEEFLIENWKQTELGKRYDIFEEDGELVGQQYQTDTGPIDILAISKDKKELVVVELKKGRASDSVVGQIQRYMGFVAEELAEDNQVVKGVIVGLEDDLRIKRALTAARNIEFYRYQVSFRLFKEK